MKFLNALALVLVVIGALNWGLWGFFQFDLVAWIFMGNTSHWARVAYGVVGVAGLWSLRFLCPCCKMLCSSGCGCTNCDCCGTKGKGKGGGCCK